MRMKGKIIASAVVVLVLLVSRAWFFVSRHAVPVAAFDQIEVGMSEDAVLRLFGLHSMFDMTPRTLLHGGTEGFLTDAGVQWMPTLIGTASQRANSAIIEAANKRLHFTSLRAENEAPRWGL